MYRQASNTFFSLLFASYAIWTLIFLCLICQNPVYRATASVKLKNIFIVTIILNDFFFTVKFACHPRHIINNQFRTLTN